MKTHFGGLLGFVAVTSKGWVDISSTVVVHADMVVASIEDASIVKFHWEGFVVLEVEVEAAWRVTTYDIVIGAKTIGLYTSI